MVVWGLYMFWPETLPDRWLHNKSSCLRNQRWRSTKWSVYNWIARSFIAIKSYTYTNLMTKCIYIPERISVPFWVTEVWRNNISFQSWMKTHQPWVLNAPSLVRGQTNLLFKLTWSVASHTFVFTIFWEQKCLINRSHILQWIIALK